MEPGLVVIVAIIVTYKLVSRNIEVRRLEAQARLRDTEGEDSSLVREELAQIREMLADLTIEDHARRGGAALNPPHGYDDEAPSRRL
jgi:hypothetical protein